MKLKTLYKAANNEIYTDKERALEGIFQKTEADLSVKARKKPAPIRTATAVAASAAAVIICFGAVSRFISAPENETAALKNSTEGITETDENSLKGKKEYALNDDEKAALAAHGAESAKTGSAKTESTNSGSENTESAKTESANTESTKTESAKTGSTKTESTNSGSANTGSTKTESAKTESANTESENTESAKTESTNSGSADNGSKEAEPAEIFAAVRVQEEEAAEESLRDEMTDGAYTEKKAAAAGNAGGGAAVSRAAGLSLAASVEVISVNGSVIKISDPAYGTLTADIKAAELKFEDGETAKTADIKSGARLNIVYASPPSEGKAEIRKITVVR